MKKLLMILALLTLPAWAMAADIDGDTDTVNNALDISKGGTDATTAENARANLGVPATAVTLAGSCTVGPCLDGTSDGGDLIKLYGPGGFWTAVQAGNAAANRSWRLPIAAAPAAGSVLLMTMDEYGQMGFLAACPNDEDTIEWDTTTTRFVCKTLPTLTTQDDNLTSGEGNIPTSAYILQFDSDGDGILTDESWWIPAASTAEINTGTEAGKAVTPDALAGSNLGSKELGWVVVDSDVVTAVADGKQAIVVPSSMNGMNLVDVTCSVSDLNSAAADTTTVVIRRVRDATAADMTSTGVTIAYDAYTASDETVDTSNDDVATGDKIFIDVNAVTDPVQKGLYCTAVFRLP